MTRPADFLTPLEEITATNLTHRLLIGIERFKGTRAEKDKEIEKLPEAVNEFMLSADHGLIHSRQVFARAEEIMQHCPALLRHSHTADLKPHTIKSLLTWAALLHDLSRFLGYQGVPEHQLASAQLALACFSGSQPLSDVMTLYALIRQHDYLSPISSHESLPELFENYPLAEIFRLADKTTLPPAEELERYYQTGKRLGGVFFNPNLTLEERFAFDWAKSNDWDFLNFFLVLFTITPRDWLYNETSDLYRQWENEKGGKYMAIQKIYQLAKPEHLSEENSYELYRTVTQFFKHFQLPFPQ